MTVTDSTRYELGTLQDIMHLGDMGWMRINKFIIDQKKLELYGKY